MLKKIFIFSLLFFSLIGCANAYTPMKISDVQGTGEYKEYRKLVNHDYTGLYEIYYKKNSDNTIAIVVKSNFENQSEEPLTFKYGNKSITLTKKQWNYLFNDFEKLKDDDEALKKVTGEFFTYWITYYINVSPYQIAQEYCEDKAKLEEIEAKLKAEDAKFSNLTLTEEHYTVKGVPKTPELIKQMQKAYNEQQELKTKNELATRRYAAYYQVYRQPRIQYDANGNFYGNIHAPIGFINVSELEKLNFSVISSNYSYRIVDKYNNKLLWFTNVPLNSRRRINADGITMEFIPSGSPYFGLNDLIKQSVINRLFIKDEYGHYIPNPYYPKENKENIKNFFKSLLY